jgi:hypothetical protein
MAMADFDVFWRNDIEEDDVIVSYGTDANAQNFGLMHPSVNSFYEQYIVPIENNPRGFVFKGSTYIKLLNPKVGGGFDHLVFGSENDMVINHAEQRLDTGISFQAGRDYYIYLCYKPPLGDQRTGQAVLVISLNSTFPQGYDADTSRKIGGFHTLCVGVGTIAGHPLSGFNSADILPASFWDLRHRPTCQPEGMVYVKELDFWADIYLQSGSLINTRSFFGGTVTKSQSYSQHLEDLFTVGKTALYDEEFSCAAEGSNQRTNIQGSADPITTGGKVDTAGRRMISNYGIEDCAGAYWQWLAGWSFGSNQTAAYVADGTKGSIYQTNALLAGGSWSNGTSCGSRARTAHTTRLTVATNYGCRGRARSRASR